MHLLLTILLLLLPTTALATWPDTEARCDDLGADCRCSEPLDSNDTTSGGWVDPDESTTDECGDSGGDGRIWFTDSSDRPTFELVSTLSTHGLPALPAGHSVTRYMLDQPYGQLNVRDQFITMDDGTYCKRHYVAFSDDFAMNRTNPSGGQGERAKMLRTKGSQVTHETELFGTTMRSFENPPGPWDWPNPSRVDPLQVTAVRGTTWVRWEECYDHDGSNLQHRVRATRMDDIENPTGGTMVADGTMSTFTSDSNNWIVDGYRQNCSPGSGSCAGYTLGDSSMGFLGAMTALVQPEDKSFWIGPATEIEGDGGPTLTVTVDPTTEDSPGTPELTATNDATTPTFAWECDGDDLYDDTCDSTSGPDTAKVCTCPELAGLGAITLGVKITSESPDLEDTVVYTLTAPPASATIQGATITGGTLQ